MAHQLLLRASSTTPGVLFNFYQKNPSDATYGNVPLNAAPQGPDFLVTGLLQGHVYDFTSKDVDPVTGLISERSNEVVSVDIPFPPTPVAPDMRDVDGFLVLAGSTITNTGPTVVNGDIGVAPGSAITGFPPGMVSGVMHRGGTPVDFVSPRAQAALVVAMAFARASKNPGDVAPTDLGTAVDIGGKTLGPGVYNAPDSLAITGRLVLDAGGNPQAVFIFVAGTTINLTGDIILANGAQASNIFWVAGSSSTVAAGSSWAGTLMADQSITLATGATVNGRVLARVGAVTLDTNTISLFEIAQLGFWLPDHFYSIGQIIPDCATGSFQRVIVAGMSGHTIPKFNVGTNAITQEGPSNPQLTWTDPPEGSIFVVGPPAPAPPNVPPPPPQAPPAPTLIIVPGSEI